MSEITPGIYRHYKGNRYEVLAVAKHSETVEEMVVYQALYGQEQMWVRPRAMFTEDVEHEGNTVLRFVLEQECTCDNATGPCLAHTECACEDEDDDEDELDLRLFVPCPLHGDEPRFEDSEDDIPAFLRN